MARRKKTHNSNNIIWGVIIVILIILLFTKNNKNENSIPIETNDGYDKIAIVVGNVENSPKPTLENHDELKDAIKDVFMSTQYGKRPNVFIISASGNPLNIKIDDEYNLGVAKNDIATNENFSYYLKGIEMAISSSPSNAGADYFNAILMALESVKDAKKPLVVIIGSGLSDIGVFNFAFDDLINKKNEDENYIINILIKIKYLKESEFNGIYLIWYGCGRGIQEQVDLKEWKKVVESIYADIFNYLGIEYDFETINIDKNTTSVPTEYDVNTTVVDKIEDGYTINLTERFVSFDPDSAVVKNITQTKELLNAFAKLVIDKNLHIKITGYQTVCAKTEILGQRRAEAIKRILIDLGVNKDLITTYGVAGPPDDRVEEPRCGSTGIATEHRTVRIEVIPNEL